MVGSEQADWKGGQEDGLLVDLKGEEKEGKGRIDLKWGEREGGTEGESEREREKRLSTAIVKINLHLFFSPK